MNLELRNKHVLVVGLGASGKAAAHFCRRRGARVTVTDQAAAADLADQLEWLTALGCQMELGGHDARTFEKAELIVLSPGVDHRLPVIQRAHRRGIPVIGEIELASRFIDAPIVAVTGTNGKTTTTSLIGEMLAQSGIDTYVGGNIGRPLIDCLDLPQVPAVLVVEISSFQLDTIDRFRPRIAVLLNISADHLDRYDDFQAYARSKMRIFKNQQPDDLAIVNTGDPLIAEWQHKINACRLQIEPGLTGDVPATAVAGARITAEGIVLADWGRCRSAAIQAPVTVARADIGLCGEHNLENAAAAALASLNAGATPEGVKNALAAFKGLPHRMEDLGQIDGVRYINDSKATNMGAVVRALQSIREPAVLILGGRNKGGDFRDLTACLHRRVRGIVAMGESSADIEAALAGTCRTVPASDMRSAVDAARSMARQGDAVVLSPGCASFDMYSDYTQRGDDFKKRVNALKNAQPMRI